VIELAVGEPQSVADLAQAFRLGELAEQHGHTLGPAGEAFCVAFGFRLAHQALESGAGNDLQDLAEQAGIVFHENVFSYGWMCLTLPYWGTSRFPPTQQALFAGTSVFGQV